MRTPISRDRRRHRVGDDCEQADDRERQRDEAEHRKHDQREVPRSAHPPHYRIHRRDIADGQARVHVGDCRADRAGGTQRIAGRADGEVLDVARGLPHRDIDVESGLDDLPVARRADNADDGMPVIVLAERELEALADRVLARPQTIGGRLADDGTEACRNR
jgi:hypothetical protein